MTVLSFVVPIYNVRPYLAFCLESLARQVDSQCEVILVDDASTDGSAEQVIEFLKEKDTRQWKLVSHKENRGLSAARNSGLSAARGDYVWFLDSDDALVGGAVCRVLEAAPGCDVLAFDYLDMYEKQRFEFREDNPSGAIISTEYFEFWVAPKRSLPVGIHQTDPSEVAYSLLTDVRTYAWSFVCRRTLCEQAEFPSGRYYEDVATTPLWLLRASTISYLPEPLVAYRRRHGSITSVANPHHLIDLGRAYQNIIDSLQISDPQKLAACSDILSAAWLQMLSWSCRDLALAGDLRNSDIKLAIIDVLQSFRKYTRNSSFVIFKNFIAARGRKEALFAFPLLFGNLDLFIATHRALRNRWVRKLIRKK